MDSGERTFSSVENLAIHSERLWIRLVSLNAIFQQLKYFCGRAGWLLQNVFDRHAIMFFDVLTQSTNAALFLANRQF